MKKFAKMKLSELSIKSFTTVQTNTNAKTVKAGSHTNTLAANDYSDGPSHTTSSWTEINCFTNDKGYTCFVPE